MSHRWYSIGLLGWASAVLLPSVGLAQCPDWVPAFDKVQGVNGDVYASTLFDDGTGPALYAAGAFTSAGGAKAHRIAKWNGTVWSALGTGANDVIRALAVFDDGNGPALYAGGGFGSAGGVPAAFLAQWDGTSWSPVGVGLDDWVTALAVFDDGAGPALYAAGWFSTAGGSPASRVAKWDGQSWSALGSGVDNTVHALAVFDDGTGSALYAAGDFLSAGGVSAARIAKWNGSAWSPLGAGFGDTVDALAVFDDGGGAALHAGGVFSVAHGAPGNHVARWNGQSWSPLGSGTDGAVNAFQAFDDGSGSALYAGGSFATAGGLPAHGVARWKSAVWSALSGGAIVGGGVNSLGVFDDGSGPVLYAGGGFDEAGGVAAAHIAQWTTARWQGVPAHSNGLTDGVTALAAFDAGAGTALYAAGAFQSAGDLVVDGIAKWKDQSWSSVGTGFVGGSVFALTTFDDGSGVKLYAGGIFGDAGGVAATNIARWNGASWGVVGSGLDGLYGVLALTAFDDGNGPALYAGGLPADLGTSAQVMQWNGTTWTALPPLSETFDVTASISALTVFDDGQGAALYAGGTFVSAGSLHLGSIGRWDGTQWQALHNGTNGSVYALAVFDDGHGPALFAGGLFLNPPGNVARWNGSSWSVLGSGVNGTVRALGVFDDGYGPALYVGGNFTSAGGVPAASLAKWDGVAWSSVSGGTDAEVRALLALNGGPSGAHALCVGGTFANAGGAPSPNLALLQGCSITSFCYGDGTASFCPCFNDGLPGHGCDNSAGTGGGRLWAAGPTRPDEVKLNASGELSNALSIFMQGDANLFPGVTFGDGVRCAGGNLKRLYAKDASGGGVLVPGPGDPSISARSAALGDPIAPGAVRFYQTYYRDPDAGFCAAPQGDTWNVTNAVRVIW